ncbi:hypothetical protein MPLSOD_330006 [Mesorhizobium sp. SOD10]|nr:hypothetical protein MPLSOD_330006 [Mesorhizobium sp. SOD10]
MYEDGGTEGAWLRSRTGHLGRSLSCPADSRWNDVRFNSCCRVQVEFKCTFGTGSRASRCSQFLLFRNFDVTGQDVTGVIELEDVWRVRRASRVTLAFGILDDDAHGAASIVFAPRLAAGLGQDQSRIRFSIPNT